MAGWALCGVVIQVQRLRMPVPYEDWQGLQFYACCSAQVLSACCLQRGNLCCVGRREREAERQTCDVSV